MVNFKSVCGLDGTDMEDQFGTCVFDKVHWIDDKSSNRPKHVLLKPI